MIDNLIEATVLLFVGMAVVLISLSMLAGMIRGMKSLDERFNVFRIKKYDEKLKAEHVEDESNDELVAVLTAAAMAAMKKRVQIRRVQFLSSDTESTWAVTGRVNIMASHHIAKRKS